jgi:hypothetical protein
MDLRFGLDNMRWNGAGGVSIPAPVNTVSPSISGTTEVGETLTVSNGTWSGSVDSYSYQWLRDGSPISGATSSTYTPVVADSGATISAEVTANGPDASATASASGVEVADVPLTVSGLSLWLRSDVGVLDGSGSPSGDGDPVATWEDQSTNGYDVAQSTPGNRPTLVFGVKNGKPSIRFDSSNVEHLIGNMPNIEALQEGTVFIVSDTFIGGTKLGVYHDSSNNRQISWSSTKNSMIAVNSSGSIEYVSLEGGGTLGFLYSAVFQVGSPPSVYFDGVLQSISVASGTANDTFFADVVLPGDDIAVGVKSDGPSSTSGPFNGDIFEIMIYNSPLSNADREAIEEYLVYKYGL